jgi:lipase chaperone LimK
LDAENADWRQRVSKFLDLRAQILASGGAVAEQQQAITALRNTTFSAPEERIRAQTYESMRDNGDHRIF